MAIKNKDGSVYTLRGPNPLMETQEFWDHHRIELINFHVDGQQTIKDEKRLRYYEDVVDIKEELNLEENRVIPAKEFIQEIQQTPVAIVEPVVEQPPVVEKQPIPRSISKRVVGIHCVPVVETSVTDELYGETRKRRSYGQKYLMEGIPMTENDFIFQFWSSKEIVPGSVVYPQTQSKRWWRVQSVAPKSDGFVMSCIASDVNPDFS